jgi:erythromycin esterase-like protein
MAPRTNNRASRILGALLLALALLGPAPAFAQQAGGSFADRLSKNRYEIALRNGRLAGPGLPVLRAALHGAQFVLLGEDHGIAQIPQFDAAVWEVIAPAGFHTLAIETGPVVADELQQWVLARDGESSLKTFTTKYPVSIPIYNWNEEFDFLAHCARSAAGGPFRLWGLDQEFIGSPRLLLTRILAQHPGPDAAREARRLLERNDEVYAAALASGNPDRLFVMTASNDDLARLQALLRREGNAASQRLVDALVETHEIYASYRDGFHSNRQRSLLMKTTFMRDYDSAARAQGAPPKVVFKFGAYHLYKGFNPLRNLDLGDLVAELADAHRMKSVHILILALKGKQLRFAGLSKPAQPVELNLIEEKGSRFAFLEPIAANLEPEGFTLVDLRAFRRDFSALGPVDREMERLIFGYDFLVLIPEAVPSAPIN